MRIQNFKETYRKFSILALAPAPFRQRQGIDYRTKVVYFLGKVNFEDLSIRGAILFPDDKL